MTVAEFQAAFPAFVNVSVLDIARIITADTPLFDTGLWGTYLDQGLGYLVAHHLVTEQIDKRQMDNLFRSGGAAIAAVAGQVTSKAVDGVSVSFSSSLTLEQSLNPFLRTPFGQRFYWLWRMVRGPVAIAV